MNHRPVSLNPSDELLNENSHLWRYVSLRTLFLYLDGLVFIPSLTKLREGDPFEAEFFDDIAWFNEAWARRYGSNASKLDEWFESNRCSPNERELIEVNRPDGDYRAMLIRKHYFQFVRDTRFAWCWFNSARESAAMWKVYGDQGAAVRTTVGRLCACLETTGRQFSYRRMRYVDNPNLGHTDFNPEHPEDFNLLLRPFFLKRIEYQSEQEVRFVTSSCERSESRGVFVKSIHPQDWISEVRLWPRMTAEEESSITKRVKNVLPNVECARSDLWSRGDSIAESFEKQMEDDLEETYWYPGSDETLATLKHV